MRKTKTIIEKQSVDAHFFPPFSEEIYLLKLFNTFSINALNIIYNKVFHSTELLKYSNGKEP